MDKLTVLQKFIEKYDSALIAFSGGVDSTLLSKVAADILKERLLLVTVTSVVFPETERLQACRIAASLGLPHREIVLDVTAIPGFTDNNPDRCYRCKFELFSQIRAVAAKEEIRHIFDGSTADDLDDFRPGRHALRQLGIISPLLEAGFTKSDVRAISARLGLETAAMPSLACTASRFPYGEIIAPKKITMVTSAEEALRKLGFRQLRVRIHGNLARVEIDPAEMDHAWNVRDKIDRACREAGFVYTALDLRGYRTGAMNEAVSGAVKNNCKADL